MKKLFIPLILVLAFCLGCNDNKDLIPTNPIILARGDSTIVSLKYAEMILINNELEIEFAGVPTDSRCPIDAMCVWAGDGEVKLNLRKNASSTIISLHTTLSPKLTVIENYEIQLSNLFPLRRASEQLAQNQYGVELKIKNLNPINPKPIYLIDSNNEGLIRKSLLSVNDVYVDNNQLTFSVSYSGGCKNHAINLYAYSGIMKSSPPQMSLILSHENNGDLCEAWITNKLKFELKNLKTYLNGMGIFDKIILNVSTPDGNPIKQSPLVYYLK